MPSPASNSAPRIGIFDSGLGGLSVLKAVHRLCPSYPLLYVADSAHAPYGERGDAFVLARSEAVAAFLLEQAAQVLVVACNTATAAAIAHLRARYPGTPIVGVEPGIKPAAERSPTGRIGVMATTGTLHSEKFRLLAQAHAAHVQLVLQPCPGLAAAIEGGDAEARTVIHLVQRYCTPLREAGVDTVVLGCTHYPFVAHHIQAELGKDVRLIDTSEAVARRVQALSPMAPDVATTRMTPRLWTTGSPATLRSFAQHWLDGEFEIADGAPA